MKPVFFVKKALLIILTVTLMVGCNRQDSSSSVSTEIPKNENPSVGSSSSATPAPAESKSVPEMSSPDVSIESSSEADDSNSHPNSTEAQKQSKIQYVKLDDERLSFTSDIQQAGSLDDLQRCTEAWTITTNDIGLIIAYGEGGPEIYTDEFVNELLELISRTRLGVLDEIPIQPPQALTLGPFVAVAYDHEGKRLWMLHSIGHLVTFELGDSGDVNVFAGELGVGLY